MKGDHIYKAFLFFNSFFYKGIISLIQAVAQGKYPVIVTWLMAQRQWCSWVCVHELLWSSLDGDSLIKVIKYLLAVVFVLFAKVLYFLESVNIQ